MRVAMGGTFDLLHAGHEALLEGAFALAGEVFIGLTTDAMALRTRPEMNPYETRRRNLEAWLKKRGRRAAEIGPIEDEYGPAVSGPFDAIAERKSTMDCQTSAMALRDGRVVLPAAEIPFHAEARFENEVAELAVAPGGLQVLLVQQPSRTLAG